MIKPRDCNGCPLDKLSYSFSLPEGHCSLGVGLLGEGLGHNEAIDGLPFRPRGAAGSLLEQAFRIVRVDRPQFLLDNVVRCQPPNNELHGYGYEGDAINHCHRAYGKRFFDNPNINIILCLGSVAFRHATGIEGKRQNISDLRGYPITSPKFNNRLVIGTYHPAAIRRGKLAWTDYLIHDLRKAIGVSNGTFRSYGSADKYKQSYHLYPGIDDAKDFYFRVKDAGTNSQIGYDIETPLSADAEEDERDEITGNEINSIQFSLGKGEGIFFPWEGEYVKIAHKILSLDNRKLCFNGWHFDNPKLRANNVSINGKIVDLMWKFHHFKPDLEMGLQKVASLCEFPFPWKHFSLDKRMERFYGCVDAEVLHWIDPKLDSVMGSMKVGS
jgi:uracil-DNA glycosylase family 4